MNTEDLELAELLFKLKIYDLEGTSFENFFIDIMERSDTEFRPVKNRGRFGDRSNDGFNQTSGKYYQVFAPLNPSLSFDKAVKKCKEDFEKLYKHWNPIAEIKEYYFVYNDKFKGTDSELEAELAKIKKDYKLDHTGVFLATDLKKVLFQLDESAIRSVVGHIPKVNSQEIINYTDLSDIIEHIINYQIKDNSELTYERVPEFYEKVEINNFSKSVLNLLEKASYQIYAIEDFFKENGSHKREIFAMKLNSIYKEKIETANFDTSDENYSDLLFFMILNEIKIDDRGTMMEASLSLMSYYFESCDIFESK